VSNEDRTMQQAFLPLKFLDNCSWPPKYEESRLVLMVRDPGCIYAYWNCNSRQYSAFVKRFYNKKSRWLIRLYTTSEMSVSIDTPVDINSGSIYINLSGDNLFCNAALGIKTNKGIFNMFIQSNTVTVPFAEYSKSRAEPVPAAADCIHVGKSVMLQSYFSGSCIG
jgi:hypothetical protein